MARGDRARRQGHEIQRLLPELIRLELKDPRVSGLLTITAVELSADLALANVYVTVLGETSPDDAVAALNRAASFLRSGLARRMRSRTVPALRFEYDASVERGTRLARLIEDAVGEPGVKQPGSHDER